MNHILQKSDAKRKASKNQNFQKIKPRLARAQKFSAEELIKQGNKFHATGQLDKAETVYRQILDVLPEHPGALHFLGIIAQQCGKTESAVLLIEKAINISPDYHIAYNSLGNAYRETQKLEKAIKCFTRAVELKPDYAEAHFNLGLITVAQGKPERAIEHFKTSAKLNPSHIQSHMEIGELFFNQGDLFNAQIAFKTILYIDKTHVAARCQLAQILEKLTKFNEAIREYKIALQHLPESIHILNGISRLHNKNGGFDEALIYLHRALTIDENNLETLHNLGLVHQSIGEVHIAAEYFNRAVECDPDTDRAEKCLLFLALNNSKYSNGDIFNLHLKLRGRHDKPKFTNRSFSGRSRDPDKKIKLGYLSSDFKTHPVALNTLSLIMGHHRDSFETYLYYHSTNNDEVTEVFKQNSDHFIFVQKMSDKEIADLIEEDEIDVCVTLAGRFDENRPLVGTYKPAPVQVSFHDCATSGLAAMDYYLTDAIIHPLTSEDKFTEELYRLPTYYQYPVLEGLPVINDTPALQNGHVTFCSFSKPEKISNEVIALWSDVLRAVPNSRILIKYFEYYSTPSMRARTIQRFAKHGIGGEQLILNSSHTNRTEHLTLYHQADICLDPFPFNGATSTFEALSMGVPVITLQGNRFVSRVATSIVTHAGHPEFAVRSRECYVALAKNLSSDIKNLDKIRHNLRKELEASTLCNNDNYVTNVEAAFREMWQNWCRTVDCKSK